MSMGMLLTQRSRDKTTKYIPRIDIEKNAILL